MRIVLVGFGSVGRALATLIEERRDDLYSRMGLAPKLVAVSDTRGIALAGGSEGLRAADLLKTKETTGSVGGIAAAGRGGPNVAHLIRDSHADVVVEASPSMISNATPAIEHIKAAFASGKHVVSVNKAPLALAMPGLEELARFNRVQFRYSGTVGAGTPVLATARTLLAGDRITRVRAILNGTTNFILWRMAEQGDTYAGALAEAVRLGYAETDPSADVDGIDTATKVVILANTILTGFGRSVRMQDVRVQGIRDIPKARVDAARANHASVKLIGEIDVGGEKPVLSVGPQEVPRFGPMDVPSSLNAVQFTLASAGETTLVGGGAGGRQTATAIVRDLVDIWNSTPH